MKAILKKMAEVKKRGLVLQRNVKAYNYKYATLDQIQEKLNPVLEEQKLVVYHRVESNQVITAVVDIETEEKIESSIEIFTTKAQDRGSEITYYRRYNLVCLFDLEVEDDDGKKAQDGFKKRETPKKKAVFGDKELKGLADRKEEYTEMSALDTAKNNYTVSEEMEKKIKALFDPALLFAKEDDTK